MAGIWAFTLVITALYNLKWSSSGQLGMVQTASGSEGIISVNICGKTSSWYALTLSTLTIMNLFSRTKDNQIFHNKILEWLKECIVHSKVGWKELISGQVNGFYILTMQTLRQNTFTKMTSGQKKKPPTPFMLMFPKLNHIIDKVMLQTIWEQHRPYVHNIISSQVPGCGTDNAKYVQTEGNYQNSPKFGNNTYSYNSQNQPSVRIVCSVKLYKQGTENFSRGHPVLFQCNIKMK